MYPGIPFSPVTETSADISAADTSIPVKDVAAFPPAPNYATLSDGEKHETVVYRAVSNGMLRDVVRGQEGESRDWLAGAKIARFYTAKDQQAFIDNIGWLDGAKTAYNPNILHNWDFRNPVNQRGQAEYAGNAIYGIDRWQTGSWGSRYTLMSEFVRLEKINASSAAMRQHIEFPSRCSGHRLTISLIARITAVVPGETASVAVICDGSTGSRFWTLGDTQGQFEHFSYTFTAPTMQSSMTVSIGIGTATAIGTAIDIQAVKLEMGRTSTLTGDPPMDFGRELAICQRFYEKSYSYTAVPGSNAVAGLIGTISSGSTFFNGLQFKVSKRIVPVVTIFGRTGESNVLGHPTGSEDLPGTATAFQVGTEGISRIQTSATNSVGAGARFHYVASADL